MRLFTVDDHAMIRDGIRLLVEQTQDVQLVGEAASVDEALARIEETAPDVVLVDLRVPPRSGKELLVEVRKRWPQMRTIALTMERDERTVLECLSLGASGYVTKDTHLTKILDAARQVAAGETVVIGVPAERIMERLSSGGGLPEGLSRGLTPREREVLVGIADGLTNQQIASRMGVTPKTVAAHVGSIYRKLEVTNRVDAAREAFRLQLVDRNRP